MHSHKGLRERFDSVTDEAFITLDAAWRAVFERERLEQRIELVTCPTRARVGAWYASRQTGRRRSLSHVTSSSPRPAPPLLLAVVCLLTLLEAALAAGLGIAWAIDLVTGRAEAAGATAFLALFALGIACLLGACARGLWRGRRWARSPVMTWQVPLIVLAVGWLGAEVTVWAVLVLAVALVVGIGLVLPPVVRATAASGAPSAEPSSGSSR
jgi:hypothetical protein